MRLFPLSTARYEFNTPQGAGLNHYFFVEDPQRGDAAYRAALRDAVDAAQREAIGGLAVQSVYVYERTDKLNAAFKGDASQLSGVYDRWLVSYTRSSQGRQDIFYMVDDGNVVFDLLKNEPVSPSFEFD